MPDVSKEERVLLVVANLTTHGKPEFEWLYEWLDQNTVRVANWLMGPRYRHIDTLINDEATKSGFVNRIIGLAQDPQTKALDVFLSLHGNPGTLYFHDGEVETGELKSQLQAADLKHRLRLLYSTACHGITHADDFVKAGFRVASGAKQVNANGPYDYPTQLRHWGRGDTYRAAVRAGNDPIFLAVHDRIAEFIMGFENVDSEKVIVGRKLTRITSEAD